MSILSRNRHSPDPEPNEPNPWPDPQAVERAQLAAMPTRDRVPARPGKTKRREDDSRRNTRERGAPGSTRVLRDRRSRSPTKGSRTLSGRRQERDALKANLDEMRARAQRGSRAHVGRPAHAETSTRRRQPQSRLPGLELMVADAQRALDFHMGQAPSFGHSF